jgi:tRNA-splicing endonuclease subunit Sen54
MLDDDDNPSVPPSVPDRELQGGGNGDANEDDEDDDRAPNFLQFAANIKTTGQGRGGRKSIRSGEKDFEEHGTRTQVDLLERSRLAMEDVLSVERVHAKKSWTRGWYFPDFWVSEQGRKELGQIRTLPQIDVENRVVLVETGGYAQSRLIGRGVQGLKPTQLGGSGMNWLLPEEALFLLDRGSLDLWWPDRSLKELFPPKGDDDQRQESILPPFEDDSYEVGMPLTLQMAYSLLIGEEGERGKVSLQKYHVYANLKRAGLHVVRASMMPLPAKTLWQGFDALFPSDSSHLPKSLWQRLASGAAQRRPYGPLLRPGIYHSYTDIYDQLKAVKQAPHHPNSLADAEAKSPYRLHYYVWKAEGMDFSKKNPGPPDVRICVVDAYETRYPTRAQLDGLLSQCPYNLPPEGLRKDRSINGVHRRMKHGVRKVVIAVVDHGVISYVEHTQAPLEPLVDRLDTNNFGGRGANIKR